jgi:CHRD domain
MKRSRVALLGVMSVMGPLAAQTQETFKARLSPVPVDAQLAPIIAGHGSVTAVLAGIKLTIRGTFEGMHSAASAAHLHQSKVTGVRGVVIHELTVSKAVAGNVSGSLDLTPSEVDALRKGLLYVVVHSEGAPDGNLWGWLLK